MSKYVGPPMNSVHSFWNEERNVYEIWHYGKIIAETSKTETSVDICRRYSESLLYANAYQQAMERYHGIVEAYPPEDKST